jgi:hypothetical protein
MELRQDAVHALGIRRIIVRVHCNNFLALCENQISERLERTLQIHDAKNTQEQRRNSKKREGVHPSNFLFLTAKLREIITGAILKRPNRPFTSAFLFNQWDLQTKGRNSTGMPTLRGLPLGGLNGGYIGLLLLDSFGPFLSVCAGSFSGVTTWVLDLVSSVLRGAVTGGAPEVVFDDLGGLGIAASALFAAPSYIFDMEVTGSCFGNGIFVDGDGFFSLIGECMSWVENDDHWFVAVCVKPFPSKQRKRSKSIRSY